MPRFFDPRGLNLYAKPRPGESELEKSARQTGNFFLLGFGLLAMIAGLIIVFWNLISGAAPGSMAVAAVCVLFGGFSWISGRLFQFISEVERHVNQVEARLTEKEKEETRNASGTSE